MRSILQKIEKKKNFEFNKMKIKSEITYIFSRPFEEENWQHETRQNGKLEYQMEKETNERALNLSMTRIHKQKK